jgi:hypothetical protein
VAGLGHGRHPGTKGDGVALAQALAVAHEGLPAAQVDPLVQGGADPRFAALAFELGRDHAGIVEHQHIARAQQRGQVAHAQIGQRGPSRHMEHPRRIARTRGAQGNGLGGRSKSNRSTRMGWRASRMTGQGQAPGALRPAPAPISSSRTC